MNIIVIVNKTFALDWANQYGSSHLFDQTYSIWPTVGDHWSCAGVISWVKSAPRQFWTLLANPWYNLPSPFRRLHVYVVSTFCDTCVRFLIFDLIHIHTYIHTFIHSFIHTFIHTFIHSYIHTFIHSYIHTFIRSYIHTFIHSYIHTSIRPSMHPSIHPPIQPASQPCMHTCLHSYVHTCIHAYMRVRAYIGIHAYMHTCIHGQFVSIKNHVSNRISEKQKRIAFGNPMCIVISFHSFAPCTVTHGQGKPMALLTWQQKTKCANLRAPLSRAPRSGVTE